MNRWSDTCEGGNSFTCSDFGTTTCAKLNLEFQTPKIGSRQIWPTHAHHHVPKRHVVFHSTTTKLRWTVLFVHIQSSRSDNDRKLLIWTRYKQRQQIMQFSTDDSNQLIRTKNDIHAFFIWHLFMSFVHARSRKLGYLSFSIFAWCPQGL